MRKLCSTLSAVAILIVLIASTVQAVKPSPNYATNTHSPNSLYYYGYVQCQPSFEESNGLHAIRGYIRYMRPSFFGGTVVDSGRQYTPMGSGSSDSRILSKNYTFTDTVNPIAKKTEFYYDFEWITRDGIRPYASQTEPDSF